jgi:hypothetical protein
LTVSPYLAAIRRTSKTIRNYVHELSSAVSGLAARPDFESLAESEMRTMERELSEALDQVRSVRAQFDALQRVK